MRSIIQIGVVLAVLTSLIYLRFPDYFATPNTKVIESWGDGYKAYHAILYHAQYDTTLTHFSGMNYPYGEHVVPGACQPLLSNGIILLGRLGIDLKNSGFAVVHFSLLLGLLLCGLFLYLIFRQLKLPFWYSLVLAIALTFLAPQIERFTAHYGLSHPELIPIIYYLLLRWHQSEHWGWSVGVGFVLWTYSLIHFYYFAIIGFAIIGFVGVRWLAREDWWHSLRYMGHGILMIGLPFLFFYFWMMYNDPVVDRNPFPYGFFAYRSYPLSIYTNTNIPHWGWLNEHLLDIPRRGFESRAYIGLVATVFALWLVIQLVRRLFKSWVIAPQNKEDRFLQYLLISGIAILIFSFGVPFVIPQLKGLLAYTGPIKQFRSIGRFAWVFYYAINIGAFYYLYQWVQKRQGAIWQRMLLLGLPLCFVLYEAYYFNRSHDLRLDEIENFAEGHRFTDRGIDFSQYQAIMPIPFANIGSDNFWWDVPGWMSQKPFTMSLQSGLPVTSSMLTRTSLSQTLNQLQWVTEPYRIPKILEDLPNDKPLLLLWDDVRQREQGDRYSHLNTRAKRLYEADYLHIYELLLNSFELRLKDRIQQVDTQLDSAFQRTDSWYVTDSLSTWYYDNFDAYPRENAYRSQGEYPIKMEEYNVLLDTVWQADYHGPLVVSFWQFLNTDRSARAEVIWQERDATTGEVLHEQFAITRSIVDLFDDQGWGMIEWNIERKHPGSRLHLSIHHPELKGDAMRVDELLLRPDGTDIGRRLDNGIWWNNRYYPNDLR